MIPELPRVLVPDTSPRNSTLMTREVEAQWLGIYFDETRPQRERDKARDALILGCAPLVHKCYNYLSRVFPDLDPDDYFQVGMEAAIYSLSKYNPDLGCRWFTYVGRMVELRIRERLFKDLTGGLYVPTRLSGDVQAAKRAARALDRNDGEAPKVGDLARMLGMEASRVERALCVIGLRQWMLCDGVMDVPTVVHSLQCDRVELCALGMEPLSTPEDLLLEAERVAVAKKAVEGYAATLGEQEARIWRDLFAVDVDRKARVKEEGIRGGEYRVIQRRTHRGFLHYLAENTDLGSPAV